MSMPSNVTYFSPTHRLVGKKEEVAVLCDDNDCRAPIWVALEIDAGDREIKSFPPAEGGPKKCIDCAEAEQLVCRAKK